MRLTRFFQDAVCTLGVLISTERVFRCYVLERPPTGDHPCIPPGTYTVGYEMHHPSGPDPYRVPVLDTAALGRTHIQIHIANRASELLGCLAVGEHYSTADHCVDHSHDAFERLMAYLKNVGSWQLEIVDAVGTDPETLA